MPDTSNYVSIHLIFRDFTNFYILFILIIEKYANEIIFK